VATLIELDVLHVVFCQQAIVLPSRRGNRYAMSGFCLQARQINRNVDNAITNFLNVVKDVQNPHGLTDS
jgi:hypothetical protein